MNAIRHGTIPARAGSFSSRSCGLFLFSSRLAGAGTCLFLSSAQHAFPAFNPANHVVLSENLFTYSPAAPGRLLSETAGPLAITKTYEPRPRPAFTASPNLLNQYTSVSTFASSAPLRLDSPTYDPDGNMTSDGVFTYTWDAENRLASVSSNGVSTNTYDGLARQTAARHHPLTVRL